MNDAVTTLRPPLNHWDWPDMGEVDAYLDARKLWEAQASRLSLLISTLRDTAHAIEHGLPPYFVPPNWPSQLELQQLFSAAMEAFIGMGEKWRMIPNDKKSSVPSLPSRTGWRQPIE